MYCKGPQKSAHSYQGRIHRPDRLRAIFYFSFESQKIESKSEVRTERGLKPEFRTSLLLFTINLDNFTFS